MDAKGLVVLPGQGLVWNMAPGRSAVLKLLSTETDESVMMFEETAPAGAGTDFHLHRESNEVAYILGGEVTIKIGDRVTVGGSGTSAFIPRGVPHAWKVTGAETGHILFLYSPAMSGKMFEDSQRLQHALGSVERHTVQELRRRYGSETVGPPPF